MTAASYNSAPARTQRGLASVEFAIVVPVLLLLMYGSAEVGRLVYQYNTLTKASRDGARYAASHAALGSSGVVMPDANANSAWSKMVVATQNLVTCGYVQCGGKSAYLDGLAPGNVSVTSPDPLHVTITATYTYQPMLGSQLNSFGFGPSEPMNIPLTATLTVRAL